MASRPHSRRCSRLPDGRLVESPSPGFWCPDGTLLKGVPLPVFQVQGVTTTTMDPRGWIRGVFPILPAGSTPNAVAIDFSRSVSASRFPRGPHPWRRREFAELAGAGPGVSQCPAVSRRTAWAPTKATGCSRISVRWSRLASGWNRRGTFHWHIPSRACRIF